MAWLKPRPFKAEFKLTHHQESLEPVRKRLESMEAENAELRRKIAERTKEVMMNS